LALTPFTHFFSNEKVLPTCSGLAIASASLSSCSRASYSFNTKAPAYLGAEQVRVATAAAAEEAETVTASAPEAALPVVTAAPAHEAARALAHHVATPAAAKAEVAAPEKAEKVKFDRKAFKKEVKRQLAAAPKSTTAEGKSQLTALLLNIFLGALGIHRFYLGYVGRGILYIALFLTSFLILPAIALFVLEIIDLIRIITGQLKPKNGEYGKTFNK
jgi:TM2 domain-containing membrane protein YozV